MVSLNPIPRALVPVDSAAAATFGAPNYDEFQSDAEVWDLLRKRPESVLRVTMPHCDVESPGAIGIDGDDESLARARENFGKLVADPRIREVRNVLWAYEITRPEAPQSPQIGLGGLARTDEIRSPDRKGAPVIRNEGIRETKARGRARLTQATGVDMGTVNLAIDDAAGEVLSALSRLQDATPNFECVDETENRHRVWLIEDTSEQERLIGLLAREPRAYVADGNHRSAAAAMLGHSHYLAVLFPASTMTIAPYNRLVRATTARVPSVAESLRASFVVEPLVGTRAFQPSVTHDIGLYDGKVWHRLTPRIGVFDPDDAAQDIDAAIVQRHFFAAVLGICDPSDSRLTFVGANRNAAWLQAEVDSGRFQFAVTLPPVTMRQFVRVCLQDKLMPPKSTWFVPKVRTGLVMALL